MPCRQQGRFTPFWECVERLERPAGTPPPIVRYNNSVAQARNQITRVALEQGADAIFFLDDDMLFTPDVLMRLLARPEAIVIGLTMMRVTGDDGQFYPIWSDRTMTPVQANQRKGQPGQWQWESVQDVTPGPNGLKPLVSGTGGGVLIRRKVFETVPDPWWQMGHYDPEMFHEDIFFYETATDYGFQVWGDPSVRFGHYDLQVLWPHQREDGTWSTVIGHGFNGFMELPWRSAAPARDLVPA